jgi:hypothetical protein
MPNSNNSQKYQLSDFNADGTVLGQAANDRISFYNEIPVKQRSNPQQQMVQGTDLAMIMSYNANGGTLSQTAANTAANQAITAAGVLATDFPLAFSKPTAQGNLGTVGLTISANDTFRINFVTSNGAATATANQTYVISSLRGGSVISANLSPANVTTKTAAEQIFTISPATSAIGIASVNSAGQISGVSMTATGANMGVGYYTPPTVVFTPANGYGGFGASGVAIVANGTVVGVNITNPGEGYTANQVTVSFLGGTYLAPGMAISLTKNAYQANLGIGNVRIVDNNKIGIQFFNVGSANITPTANETYKMVAYNEMPAASPLLNITANLANLTAAAANASNKTDVTVTGLDGTELLMVTNHALASPLVFGGGSIAANTVSPTYGGGVPGGTPANGVYSFAVFKQNAPSPIQINIVNLTPASVAANTAAEEIYTLPANVTLQANSAVKVICLSDPGSCVIAGARANSTTTLGINWMNVTTAAVTPPAGPYMVINYASYPPDLSANQLAGFCAQTVKPTYNQLVDLANEQQQAMQQLGLINGA